MDFSPILNEPLLAPRLHAVPAPCPMYRPAHQERPPYLQEIKKDLTYFKRSCTRADPRVDIEDVDGEQAAHHRPAQLKAYRP